MPAVHVSNGTAKLKTLYRQANGDDLNNTHARAYPIHSYLNVKQSENLCPSQLGPFRPNRPRLGAVLIHKPAQPDAVY